MGANLETGETVAVPQRVIDIVTDRGIPFRVAYGNRPYSSGELAKFPTVAFYDARYTMNSPVHAHGQFVADYSVETLFERHSGYPLNLYGSEGDWTINANAMSVVRLWLINHGL